MLSHKKIKELLNLLPFLILLFLISNFIFNCGYFISLGIKNMGLLSLPDYYEGTAPYMIFCLLFFACVFITGIDKDNLEVVKFFTTSIKRFVRNIIVVPSCLLYYKIILFVFKMQCRNGDFHHKRIYVQTSKKINEMLVDIKEYMKLFMWVLARFILSIIAIAYPIYWLFEKMFHVDKSLYFVSILAYLITLILVLFVTNKKIRIIVSVLFYFFCIFILGAWMLLKNYNDLSTIVKTKNNKEYSLIRPINKGVFLKDKGNDVIFYKWESVESITRRGGSKNAK